MGLCCGGDKKENVVDPLIIETKTLGPPKYDDEDKRKVLNFEYYVNILRIQIKWFARDFQKQKDILAYERRSYLQDEVTYRKMFE